ncbi:MAG: sigma-54-dependent Fis family transcriptional regulator [Planctomycetes bacterium]|nr:sigma-54-dependent Fis family transcriptional regulator [Planctomycetota bacterium]
MPSHATILVIDDEEGHAEATAESLERVGHRCIIANSGEEGLRILSEEPVDLIVTDLKMHDVDGMEILETAKRKFPDIEVIMVTGYPDYDSVVEAMQKGAATYLRKPVNIDELRTVVEKSLQKQALARRNVQLEAQLDEKFGFEGIIGSTPPMRKIFQQVRQIAPTTATVLITGESGTGKELIASAIHNNSPRKNNAFVALNCAALSESILESELFGHEKGAFTGADSMRKGRFEFANHGTLFLDEVGDLPIETQIKLLRVIEQREITRVGSNTPIKVNVRLLAATHQDLEALVEEKKFRQDLYFRFNVVSIHLPPLRERRDDIPLMINAFIREFTEIHGKQVEGIDPEAREILCGYSWPGNVRELKNSIESMVVVSTGKTLTVADIPDSIPREKTEVQISTGLVAGMSLEDAEKELIRATLDMTHGNREETAKILKIGERTLYRKLEKYGLR